MCTLAYWNSQVASQIIPTFLVFRVESSSEESRPFWIWSTNSKFMQLKELGMMSLLLLIHTSIFMNRLYSLALQAPRQSFLSWLNQFGLFFIFTATWGFQHIKIRRWIWVLPSPFTWVIKFNSPFRGKFIHPSSRTTSIFHRANPVSLTKGKFMEMKWIEERDYLNDEGKIWGVEISIK